MYEYTSVQVQDTRVRVTRVREYKSYKRTGLSVSGTGGVLLYSTKTYSKQGNVFVTGSHVACAEVFAQAQYGNMMHYTITF